MERAHFWKVLQTQSLDAIEASKCKTLTCKSINFIYPKFMIIVWIRLWSFVRAKLSEFYA
ncbi:MAG: hypothetical protein ACTS4X_01835 [Candidatus Hodgkinia cicadicola]